MPFGLTIGTERAAALQQSIQDELTKRGYSHDADPVMAEYITIMIINNKTAAQITSELEDLIGSEFDHSFTDWLFTEAAKGASGSNSPSHPQPSTSDQAVDRDLPPHISNDTTRHLPNPPRNGVPLYQQAISQAIPSTSSAHKRPASARSLSPGLPNKSRRTDLPTGPRAMLREGNISGGTQANSRSLIERVGGPAGPIRNSGNALNGFPRDEIQARIDNITNNSPDPNMMMTGGFPNGMDMNAAMGMGMANPIVLQEMMLNQMAMMAQMASSMGMMNPVASQFGGGPGFPMQVDRGMFQGGMNGFPGPQQHMNNGGGRGRGSTRGGRGMSRGRGGQTSTPKTSEEAASSVIHAPNIPIASPTPTVAAAANPPLPSASIPSAAASQPRTGYVPPERPASPTLCKFVLKCTNALCRYSHPSPVATTESGVVLSNEACEKGKDCKDKDCIKAHVSPAVLTASPSELLLPSASFAPPTPAGPQVIHNPAVPCRFGAACTRPNCPYTHPAPRPSEQHKSNHNHFAQQCRFGASCTRSTCPFQHPEGRVLPTTFHRGLSNAAPMVNVQTPEAGSMGGPSPHKSVTFNNSGGRVKEKLERQMKEIEEKKSEAQRAVKEAEAAASKKEAAPVAIAA